MALVMKNNNPLLLHHDPLLPRTQKNLQCLSFTCMFILMPKKVLDFPMQIDKHIVINSCDNQEYI